MPEISPLAPARDRRIAFVGLGYVGLPLAVAFAGTRPVTGFDISDARIAALRAGRDDTREVTAEDLTAAPGLHLTSDPSDLRDCDTFIPAYSSNAWEMAGAPAKAL